MIRQTLIYGGYDLAPLCERNSLEVRPIRKVGRSWTDLNRNDHGTTIGWSYEVVVRLNPLTYQQAQDVFDLIKSGPQTLVFEFSGLAGTQSQMSIVDNFPLSPTFAAHLCKNTTELTFREQYP